jgi:8-oxo-dGTP diphosphatase
MKRFASVVLVDRRGWVLLQERDEHPVLDPEKWGFVGGGVEPGEAYVEAARRELLEETGLAVPDLHLFGRFPVFHHQTGGRDEFELFYARVDLVDSDIVVGEGRQIVFVAPEAAVGLDLTASATIALPSFLRSGEYDAIVSRGVA